MKRFGIILTALILIIATFMSGCAEEVRNFRESDEGWYLTVEPGYLEVMAHRETTQTLEENGITAIYDPEPISLHMNPQTWKIPIVYEGFERHIAEEYAHEGNRAYYSVRPVVSAFYYDRKGNKQEPNYVDIIYSFKEYTGKLTLEELLTDNNKNNPNWEFTGALNHIGIFWLTVYLFECERDRIFEADPYFTNIEIRNTRIASLFIEIKGKGESTD